MGMMRKIVTLDGAILSSKIIISIWLIYHLCAVLIMPNTNSFINRNYGDYFTLYANPIALNQPWTFFSPDPSLIYTLHYEVEHLDENGELTTLIGEYPSHAGNFLLSTRSIKEFYQIRFLMKNLNLLKDVFVDYMCVHTIGAQRVSVNVAAQSPPSLENSRLLSSVDYPGDYESREILRELYECN